MLGEQLGISREEMSYLNIRDLLDARLESWDLRESVLRSIESGIERASQTESLLLPPLIVSADDARRFHLPETQPNFVTRRVVDGPARPSTHEDLAGAIVFIPSADPGFDWLFTRGIGGLVTAYGGSNSHMAIRAAELDLPAVIGAGEHNFNMWCRATRLQIDCCSERVEVIA